MDIRKAAEQDLGKILEIYAQAREFMVQTGNPRQWAARNWPPEQLVLQDIRRGKCHVCVDRGQVAAVFYYDFGEDIDPTYRCIEDGGWLRSGPYGVVHRIAALPGHGAGRVCLQWAWEQCGHLRIDTHPDNRVMQHVLESMGFSRRGIIHIFEDNDPRIAYEK